MVAIVNMRTNIEGKPNLRLYPRQYSQLFNFMGHYYFLEDVDNLDNAISVLKFDGETIIFEDFQTKEKITGDFRECLLYIEFSALIGYSLLQLYFSEGSRVYLPVPNSMMKDLLKKYELSEY